MAQIRSTKNKLWLISQDERNDYDTFNAMVVCAETEEEAKNIHPCVNWDPKDKTWASSPENVSADLIGYASEDTEPGIVLASYNAG